MDDQITVFEKDLWPESFLEIPQPPKKLFIIGQIPDPKEYTYLCVIGSRKYSSYGREVCEKLIEGLTGYPIVIVSGLALGIDSLAHESALLNGLKTVAFPGSGLSKKVIYPRNNFSLAQKIVNSGGCLISELDPETKAAEWTFPQRNRLMAGISKAVLIIEAEEKSGTSITAKLAIDYNKDVFAVPGSIFSTNSAGPNRLIRDGATPIRNAEDLLLALGFKPNDNIETPNKIIENCSPEEKEILVLLNEPMARSEISRATGKSISEINQTLSIMEIKGIIKESLGEINRSF